MKIYRKTSLIVILFLSGFIGVAEANMSDLFNKYSKVSTESHSAESTNLNTTQNKMSDKPVFKFIDLDGNTHTNQSTRGKYLIINFWATWCVPCIADISNLINFYKKHSYEALIVGLNYEKAERKDIVSLVDELNINYPIILFSKDNGPQFSKFIDIQGMPTTIIYNPKGELIDTHLGQISPELLKGLIL